MTRGKASQEASPPVDIRMCAECGKPFNPARQAQKYCSANCRKNASRKRNKTGQRTSRTKRPPKTQGKPKPKKTEEDLTEEAVEEMMDPSLSYKQVLELSVRRLRKAVADKETPLYTLPKLTEELLAAAKELESIQEESNGGLECLLDEEDDDGDEFGAEAI